MRKDEGLPSAALTKIAGGVLVVIAFLVWLILLWGVKPDAGHEAVLIHKPLIFGHGGVDADPVKTGRKYVWWTTDSVMVNMQPLQFGVHFDDLMSSDGVPLDFDGVIRLQITNSVRLIREFGPEWYQRNVQSEFQNRVRQAVRKHGMNETAINTQAVDAIDREVSEAMETYIADAKLPLKLIQITVGKANPPDSIKSQRIETAAQQQRVLTEQQRKLAEDSRQEAERSRAKADNAYREAMQLSPQQFLQLETIKMQQAACASGHCTFIAGSSATPVIDARK
jgi:regulator of protease activity HflC (stomatin/prohibitin superfamily)